MNSFWGGMALKSLHVARTLELRDLLNLCAVTNGQSCVSIAAVHFWLSLHRKSNGKEEPMLIVRPGLSKLDADYYHEKSREILGERLASLTGFFQAQLWFGIFTCCILLCAGTGLSALLNHLSESTLFLLLEIEGCDEKDRRMSEPHKKTYPDLRTQVLPYRFLLPPTFFLVSR